MTDRISEGVPMRALLVSVLPLLLGYGTLQAGNALQSSLLSVRADQLGFAATEVGFISAGFWIGMIMGSSMVPRLVYFTGQVRVFAALASLASAAALLHLLFQHPASWIATRVMTGICYAGLFICVESWLNAAAGRSTRGQVFAVYGMTGLLFGIVGQLLLPLGNTSGYVLFCIVSVIISLSLVPIALSGVRAPALPLPPTGRTLPWRTLYARSPFGVLAAPLAGACAGSFFGLGPYFAVRSGMSIPDVATFMAVASLGAFLFSWPLGRLSDVMDRRLVVVCCSGVATALLVKIFLLAPDPTKVSLYLQLLFAFGFGALIVPIYGVVAAHVNDRMEPHEYIKASGRVLVLYGTGSAVGPVVVGAVVSSFGDPGFPLMIALLQAIIAIVGIIRVSIDRGGETATKRGFLPEPATPAITGPTR